jgi:hydroxyacylglutathione hydrolase
MALLWLCTALPPSRPTFISLADEQVLELGDLRLLVLHTPGHTEDSLCIYFPGAVFTGDTLFVGKVGGTDLGEGARLQYDSLHRKLMSLPPDTAVYPGHDVGVRPTSTIGDESKQNPFLLQPDLEHFVDLKRNWLKYKAEHGIK